MSWDDPYPTRYIDTRRAMCERCGEQWLHENLGDCVNCKLDACPYCGQSVSIKGRPRDEWWCKVCLQVAGITADDFDNTPPAAPVPAPFEMVQPTMQSISIDNLKLSILRSRTTTFIAWPEDKERRKILRKSLRVLKFNVVDNGLDFKVAPSHLPKTASILEFTEAGIRKLTETVGEMNPFPGL